MWRRVEVVYWCVEVARSAVNRKVGGSSPPRDGRSFLYALETSMETHFELGEVAVHALANQITFMLVFTEFQIEKKPW